MVEIDYTTGFWLDCEEGGAVFTEGPYHDTLLSICGICVENEGHKGFAPICSLYPKGIPPDIWLEKTTCPKFCKKVKLPKAKPRGKL